MRVLFGLILVSTLALAQPAASNPQLASAKAFFDLVKGNIVKSAEKMPEAKYSFKASPDVRTYAQLLAHVADAQYFFCGAVKEDKGANKGIEKSGISTRAELTKALNEAFAYCDGTYAALTDANSAAMVPFFGENRTKLSILSFNTAHTFEHYGNLVTYLRMNGLVPPSSEPKK